MGLVPGTSGCLSVRHVQQLHYTHVNRVFALKCPRIWDSLDSRRDALVPYLGCGDVTASMHVGMHACTHVCMCLCRCVSMHACRCVCAMFDVLCAVAPVFRLWGLDPYVAFGPPAGRGSFKTSLSALVDLGLVLAVCM